MMKRLLSLGALIGAITLSACISTDDPITDITGPAPVSAIKFFNFSFGAPGVNFYANTTKVTAITSGTGTEATTGVVYGGAGAGAVYVGIDPGTYTFSGRIAAATDKDLAISNLASPITAEKKYSFYLSGPYNTTTKLTDSFIIEDNLPAVDWTVAQVRFVNASANSSPMILYVKNNSTGVETAIGTQVAYKGQSTWVSLPAGAHDLNTRLSGSSANIITRTGTSAVSFAVGKIYTVTARGDITQATSATANKWLDNTSNY